MNVAMTTNQSLSQWEGWTWPLGLLNGILGDAHTPLCFLSWLHFSAWLAWLSSDLSVHFPGSWLHSEADPWSKEQGTKSQLGEKLCAQLGAACWP